MCWFNVIRSAKDLPVKCLSVLTCVVLLSCASGRTVPRVQADTDPWWCNPKPPMWLLPASEGYQDSTLAAGTGGLALRPVDAITRAPLNSAQVVLTRDTLQLRDWVAGDITKDGVAMVRDLSSGRYLVSFSYIGYQSFVSKVSIVDGVMSTVDVAVYPVPVCLSEFPVFHE